jgi:hypothetical protein
MTDQEIQSAYEDMIGMWGDKLPNHEHEPIRFAFYVRMYKYLKNIA